MHALNTPLAGTTVVALEQAVAAPLATRHLADLGARVIKIERVGEGDFARHYDSHVHGLASHFVWLNRRKESIELDLAQPAGREILQRLLSGADVFVHNLGPGAVDRLGFDAESLSTRLPSMVQVALSGYGSGGPAQHRKAYDMLVQAESGLVSVTGTPDRATKTGIPTSDIAAGMYTAQAVLAALVRRGRTGQGAAIEISMLEATAEWMGHPMYMQMCAGIQVLRMGLSHAAIAPYDAYPTEDGQVLIGIQNDRGWRALVSHVLDAAELLDDPRFTTNQDRVRHRVACDAEVAVRTSRRHSEELLEALEQAGVPAGRVNDLQGLVEHPQLAARDRWRTVSTPVGEVPALLPPVTFSDVEARMDPVPALGQHTTALLAELGLAPDEIAAARAAGVVGA